MREPVVDPEAGDRLFMLEAVSAGRITPGVIDAYARYLSMKIIWPEGSAREYAGTTEQRQALTILSRRAETLAKLANAVLAGYQPALELSEA